MKALLKISLIVILVTSFGFVSTAQEELYNKLNSRLAVLYKQGKTEEAIKVAEEALQVAIKTFGEEHPYVSSSLNNIALLYINEGRYEKAEELYERSLVIAEAILGKDHPQLAGILENMVRCSEELGQTEKAEMLQARLENIKE
jgi:tetratricopeptide (TPR) repeat protein